ncbi:hypothetical protein GIV88_10645 [Pseudomonas syringae]|nr:hypothetical protein [Pseudomonas syringae]
MSLSRVSVTGVRNLHPVTLSPSPRINILYGANGSGPAPPPHLPLPPNPPPPAAPSNTDRYPPAMSIPAPANNVRPLHYSS